MHERLAMMEKKYIKNYFRNFSLQTKFTNELL